MHIIIGMPPHIIIIGAPMPIIDCMASQRSFMRPIIEASVGIIFMTMPSFVISQDILHIIGIMPGIIGIIMGIMPIMFMPFIIGIMFMPFMPFIIGMPPPIIIPFMGIMPFIIGIMFMFGIMLFMGIEPIPFIIGIAVFMVSSMGSFRSRTVLPNGVRAEAIAMRATSFRLS
jgi:hypothetical protein